MCFFGYIGYILYIRAQKKRKEGIDRIEGSEGNAVKRPFRRIPSDAFSHRCGRPVSTVLGEPKGPKEPSKQRPSGANSSCKFDVWVNFILMRAV